MRLRGVAASTKPESASVGSIIESNSGTFNVTVTWPAVNVSSIAPITVNDTVKYHIFVVTDEQCSTSSKELVVADFNSTSVVLPDLLPNSVYSICVVLAVNGNDFLYSPAKTVAATPQTGLACSSIMYMNVSVTDSWTIWQFVV